GMSSDPGPVVPPEVVLPEITLKAVVLSVVLAAVLAGANAYLGLFAGMTVSASIPAAVISMAVLRLFRESNILENNIVQTAASSGEALAAGVIFTIPALLLIGYWTSFDYGQTAAIAMVGGVLGVLFTIPLRRVLIVTERLRYPEGIATAEVLKVGAGGGMAVAGFRARRAAGVIGGLAQRGQAPRKMWRRSKRPSPSAAPASGTSASAQCSSAGSGPLSSFADLWWKGCGGRSLPIATPRPAGVGTGTASPELTMTRRCSG